VTVRLLEAPEARSSLRNSASCWDPDTECTLVLARPDEEPRLWSDYVDGAVRSYRRHGVETALDLDCLRSGADTALFFAVIDADERLVAGVRAKTPLSDPDESHAITEWAGQPGLAALRKMISNRIPFGVVEMKAAWVDDPRHRSLSLTTAIARSGFHVLRRLDVQFLMATAGDHVLQRWRSSGGRVAEEIPATPYPDERYQTRMMWWDRNTVLTHAEPGQVAMMLQEAPALSMPCEESQLRISGGV
jgi:hypothetical protein